MKKVAFICVHNSCRSIMAEAWGKHLASDVFESFSAGTEEYHGRKPYVFEVMEDLGVDMSHAKSKLTDELPKIDILITMGCGVECPWVPNSHKEDWGLDDPSGGEKQDFEHTRDVIKEKILDLKERIEQGVL